VYLISLSVTNRYIAVQGLIISLSAHCI